VIVRVHCDPRQHRSETRGALSQVKLNPGLDRLR
jgi:hypothetical protein